MNTLLRDISVLLLAVSGCFDLAKLISVTGFKSTKLYFSSDIATKESTRMYLFIYLFIYSLVNEIFNSSDNNASN